MFDNLSKLPIDKRLRQQLYPLPAVIAIIYEEDSAKTPLAAKYLLIKREKEPYAGKWALVGGLWEFGETLAMAVSREVKEETGLEIVFRGLYGLVGTRIAPANPNRTGAHFLLFVCNVSIATGFAITQSEGDVAWFDWDGIIDLFQSNQIVPNDYIILTRIVEQGNLPFYLEVNAADDSIVRQSNVARSENQDHSSAPNSIISAGGIVYSIFQEEIFILLICRHDDLWVLPKGHQELKETIEQAALREIYEESGVTSSDLLIEGLWDTYVDTTYSDETKLVYLLKIRYRKELLPVLHTDSKHKMATWWPMSKPLPPFRYKEQLTLLEKFIQMLY